MSNKKHDLHYVYPPCIESTNFFNKARVQYASFSDKNFQRSRERPTWCLMLML